MRSKLRQNKRRDLQLRPTADATAQDRIREAILEAYAEHEERAAVEPAANESDAVA